MSLKSIFLFIFFTSTHMLFSFDHAKLKKILPKNCTILDCGAHNGSSSLMLAKRFPDTTIIAVEADPDAYNKLVQTVKNHKRIKHHHYALSDHDGFIPFFQNDRKGQGQGSIFPQSKSTWYWPGMQLKETSTQIPSRTLDTFCQENGLSHLDLLYLDMQGGEFAMIKASKKIMKTVLAIYTEVLFEPIYENCPLYPDLKNLLNTLGFKAVSLKRRHRSFGDALFIRKNSSIDSLKRGLVNRTGKSSG